MSATPQPATHRNPAGRRQGFTLIELLVAMAIAAILAAIAYPAYREQVQSARRSEARTALMNVSGALERCFTDYNAYNETACNAVDDSDATRLSASMTTTPGGYYALSAITLSANAYSLQAAPQGTQAGDKCGNLTYDQAGQTGISSPDAGVGIADCW